MLHLETRETASSGDTDRTAKGDAIGWKDLWRKQLKSNKEILKLRQELKNKYGNRNRSLCLEKVLLE